MITNILQFFNQTGRKIPDFVSAVAFLQTEVGELVDAMIRHGHFGEGWKRNNPDKEVSVEDEIADVLMMTLLAAHAAGIDPAAALINKMHRKGWRYESVD